MSQRRNSFGRGAQTTNRNNQFSGSRQSFGGNRQFSGGRGGNGGRGGRVQKSFDPSMFVKKASGFTQVETYEPKHAFADFAIDERLKNNILAKGYTLPTPIQDMAIPHLLEGRDVIGLANTGTGKTAAFLIPLIDSVLKNPEKRVLIIAPTRELAAQIESEFMSFATSLNLFSALCIGGANMERQIARLKRNPQFVVATPGRVIDLERQHKIRFNDFSAIVLDEVDMMLDMGFVNDMRYIIDKLPEVRHSLFFSATMSDKLRAITNTFVKDPVTVTIQSRPSSENVTQDILQLKGQSKIDVLHDLLNKRDEFKKVLVFGRTKRVANKIAELLQKRGHNVGAIHGNKSQNQRMRTMQLFKTDRIHVLVATDVVARGIDIDNITHVINFDLPQTYEDYIHRIGRTGRADKTGFALTFIE